PPNRPRCRRHANSAESLPATVQNHRAPESRTLEEQSIGSGLPGPHCRSPRKKILLANPQDEPEKSRGHPHPCAIIAAPHRPRPTTSLRRNSVHRAENLPRRFHSAAQLRENQPAHQPEPIRLEGRPTETAAAQIQWSNRAPRSQPPAIPSSQSLMRTPPANCRADSSIQPLRGA